MHNPYMPDPDHHVPALEIDQIHAQSMADAALIVADAAEAHAARLREMLPANPHAEHYAAVCDRLASEERRFSDAVTRDECQRELRAFGLR